MAAPAALKGLILGPNGRPMSPSHTRRRGRIYRYYVTREAIANGYDTCPVTSVPAADVEGAVLDHIQKCLVAPELVARTWATAQRVGEDEITEREVTVLLADFATVWNELGKNMVTAIRHWALACEIIREDGDKYRTTVLGAFLFDPKAGRDPFMESPATAWLIQWMIAGRPERTTTWFYAFNHFTAQTFDREAVAAPIRDLCKERGWQRTSAATIKRDVECFIRSYVPRTNSKFSDDSMEPVLGEIGLIRPVGSKSFEFRRGPKPSLPDGVFLFALNDFWKRHAPGQNTMAVESLAYEPALRGGCSSSMSIR